MPSGKFVKALTRSGRARYGSHRFRLGETSCDKKIKISSLMSDFLFSLHLVTLTACLLRSAITLVLRRRDFEASAFASGSGYRQGLAGDAQISERLVLLGIALYLAYCRLET